MENIETKPCQSFWLFKGAKNKLYIGYLKNGKDRLCEAEYCRKDRRYNPPEIKLIWEI